MRAASAPTITERLQMSHDKLATMANQIARFMASKPADQAAAGFASHINDYWGPPMRAELLAMIAAKDAELLPLVHEAGPLIRVPQAA